jgi:hypothetical protein
VAGLAFSNDGKYMYSIGSLPTYQICLWDMQAIVENSESRKKFFLACTSNQVAGSRILVDPSDAKRFLVLPFQVHPSAPLYKFIMDTESDAELLHDGLFGKTRGMRGLQLYEIEYLSREIRILNV